MSWSSDVMEKTFSSSSSRLSKVGTGSQPSAASSISPSQSLSKPSPHSSSMSGPISKSPSSQSPPTITAPMMGSQLSVGRSSSP